MLLKSGCCPYHLVKWRQRRCRSGVTFIPAVLFFIELVGRLLGPRLIPRCPPAVPDYRTDEGKPKQDRPDDDDQRPLRPAHDSVCIRGFSTPMARLDERSFSHSYWIPLQT